MGDAARLCAAKTVNLLGVDFTAWTEDEVVGHVMGRLSRAADNRGGWILTPNVDILRKMVRRPDVRSFVDDATIAVADGMPLVWASRLQGTPLPERVTGASLLISLCAAASTQNRSVYLLGGADGVADEAGRKLSDRYEGLDVAGWSPPFGLEATPEGMAEIRARVAASGADLVFCGFGFPKQERIIHELAADLPDTWFIGCGASLTFAAGRIARAPEWMQRNGLEWVHRLVSEPRRLFRRYVIEDLPFALRLLASSALVRGLTEREIATDGTAAFAEVRLDARRESPVDTRDTRDTVTAA